MRFFINALLSCFLIGSSVSVLGDDEKGSVQNIAKTLDVAESSESAAHYFLEKVLTPAQNQDFAYQEVHGNIRTAAIVVTVFSSLACPICAELHIQALPPVLESAALKNGKLAVICRDYPADPLSLHASAAVWALPEKASEFRARLFEKNPEEIWTRDLKEMRDLVLSFCSSEKEKQKVMAVINDTQKGLMKKIFAQRSADKEPLGINEVPLVFIYSVPEKKLFTLKSCLDLAKVLDLFK